MNGHRTWLSVAILGVIFSTNANAQTQIDKLRSCLAIEDGSKEPVAKAVADCKFLKEEDERLGCFNRFLVKPAAAPKAARKVAPKAEPPK